MVPSSPALDLTRQGRALLVAFLVLSPVVFWYGLLEPFEACKSTLTQLAALVLIVLAVAVARGRSWAWRWGQLRDLFAGPVGIAVITGVGTALLSTIFSISPRTSLQGAMDSSAGLSSVLALAVLFAASRALCTDARNTQQLLSAAVVGVAIACGYAVVQALGCDPVAWEETSAFSGWLRPSGTQGHPNYLAGHVVMVLPLVVWLLLRAIERRQKMQALAAAALTVLAGATILVSLSRAAWLACAVVAVLLLAGWNATTPRRWLIVLFVVMAACLVGVSIPESRLKSAVIQRIQQQGASAGRRVIWQEACAIFKRHPWTGSGLDTFRLAYALQRTPEYWEVEWGLMPTKAHNDFLHALATQGLPGGAAYLMLPAALLVVAIRRWRARLERGWLAVLGAVVAAYYAQNLFGFSVASTSALLAVVAGALAGSTRREEEEGEAKAPEGLLVGTGLGVCLVLAGLWQGNAEGEGWRFAVTATAIMGTAVLGLIACGIPFPTSRTFIRPNFSWRSFYHPLVAPAIVGGVGAWYLLCPLVASSLSYRADATLHDTSDDALALHARAVRFAPGHALFHARRANALMRAAGLQSDPVRRDQLLRESVSTLEAACRLQPLEAGYHAGRANALLELARLGLADKKEVLAAFDRAITLDRCHWGVLTDAARAATILGCLDATERHLANGLARQPRLGMLHAEKGALELARGRLAEAEAILWQCHSLEWHDDVDRYDRAQLLLGMVFLQRGKAAESLHTTGLVLKRHADWLPAWWLHALAQERLGQKAAALREFRRVLARQPDHPQARAGVERLSRKQEAEDR